MSLLESTADDLRLRLPGVWWRIEAAAKRSGRVASRPRRGEEQPGDEECVQPERLAEEQELGRQAKQRSEREGGKSQAGQAIHLAVLPIG